LFCVEVCVDFCAVTVLWHCSCDHWGGIEETDVPIVKTTEYNRTETGEVISQLAAFAPHSIFDMNLALEMHRVADTGETHIVMRRLPDDAKPVV
jgi:hypothetical protein